MKILKITTDLVIYFWIGGNDPEAVISQMKIFEPDVRLEVIDCDINFNDAFKTEYKYCLRMEKTAG
jgi:hypothetical protein